MMRDRVEKGESGEVRGTVAADGRGKGRVECGPRKRKELWISRVDVVYIRGETEISEKYDRNQKKEED